MARSTTPRAAKTVKAAKPAKAAKAVKAAKPAKAAKAAKAAKPAKPTKPAGKPAYPAPAYPTALVDRQLAKIRAFCANLAGTVERPSHGSPAFLVDGKHAYAYFLDNHHGDDRLALWCAAPAGAQAMLIDSSPDHYFRPAYVGHKGWIGVRLDRDTPWNEIAAVLEAAYELRLPAGPRANRDRSGSRTPR